MQSSRQSLQALKLLGVLRGDVLSRTMAFHNLVTNALNVPPVGSEAISAAIPIQCGSCRVPARLRWDHLGRPT